MIHTLLTCLLTVAINAPSDWVLKSNEDGIKVYIRTIQGSNFDEFRGETIIENKPLSKVLSIILDVDHYESLYANIRSPKVLKKEGQFYDIHYQIIVAPWPVQERDAIYEQKTVVDKNGTHALITLLPKPDFMKEHPDLVRIKTGSGFWELTQTPDGNVSVIYQFHSEPGGDIPEWIVNKFVIDHPIKTLENLKKRVATNN